MVDSVKRNADAGEPAQHAKGHGEYQSVVPLQQRPVEMSSAFCEYDEEEREEYEQGRLVNPDQKK